MDTLLKKLIHKQTHATPPGVSKLSVVTIDGNEALSWSQAGPEDFILLNKYMLQRLRCSSYMTQLHPRIHSSMYPKNDVMIHGYKTWSVAVLRPDFILRDQDRK